MMRNGKPEQALSTVMETFELSNFNSSLFEILYNLCLSIMMNHFIGHIAVLQYLTYQSLMNTVSPSNLEYCNAVFIRFLTVEWLDPTWTTQLLLDFDYEDEVVESIQN
jgi:hypothetical protein